jgi:hypothetical protein
MSTNTTGQQPEKVKGPASYFPSIERTYGRPIDEWLELVRARPAGKHMETVAWLKSEHGLGHGHANAIVAHVRAESR